MGTILLFAILGTLISTIVVGYGLFGLARLGIVGLDATNPFECLTFGALISAVDPVATLSILGASHIGADPMLYALVFGESVLNDAVSIVLFNTLKTMQRQGGEQTLMHIILTFIGLSLGSVVIGIAVGLCASYAFKALQLRDPAYEFSMVVFFAYGAYCFAEVLELSGIMSLFFCGIIMAHFASHNISEVRMCFVQAFWG